MVVVASNNNSIVTTTTMINRTTTTMINMTTSTITNRTLLASGDDSYPSNMYCNFTMMPNTTVTYRGMTRYQAYGQPNMNDNNCTKCIKIGCVWCSSSPGYCYNGQTSDNGGGGYCKKDNDIPIDNQNTCNNDVTLVVFLLTIFLGIVLPILLLCGCFSCVIYFARRYMKSRQDDQRVVPVEAECSTVELQPYNDHHMYTFVVDTPVLIESNHQDNTNAHAQRPESKDNGDRDRVVAHAIAIPIR